MKLTSLIRGASVLLLFAFSALAADGPPAEPVIRKVPALDGGAHILCSVYPPNPVPAGKAGLVIHFYGTGGSSKPGTYNIGRPPYDELRRLLAARGCWLVVPTLGPLPWMNDAACKQVDAVIADMVQHENVDPTRVHLFGTSMGGGSSLIYTMRRPNTIKSLVAIFPMTDFTQWLEEMPRYRPGVEGAHAITPKNREAALRDMSPIQHPEAFKTTAIFLLHGDKDPIVPLHHSRDFAALLRKKGCEVTLREVVGETHRDEIAQTFQQQLADFLTQEQKAPTQ